MYIKHLILEGFKSYGARTDLSDFDRHFTAIAGLNGSGKSNILDSICFVLGGSTTLNPTVRFNLKDLVHKSGDGVKFKRGCVTVVFDNNDKRPGKCPLGYESYDEIIVCRSIEKTGQCKYWLNGVGSTKKKIVNMFKSIQINNSTPMPNFVIQQDRIMKVVNMKPKEILHMIEETVGVGATVYQAKRDKTTEKDMVDKNDYLYTVTNTLKNLAIEPSALAKQRKVQQFVTEYNSLEAEVNARSQQFAIGAYGEWTSSIQSMEEKLNKMKDAERSDKDQIKEIAGFVELKQKEIADIKERNNVRVKEKLTVPEKELAKFRQKYHVAKAQYESANTNQKDAEKKVEVAEKAFKIEYKQVQDFEERNASIIKESNAIQNEIKTAEANMNKTKERESEINAGKVLGDDDRQRTINLRERLIALDDEINQIRPKHDYEMNLVSNDDKSLKQKQAELVKTPSDAQIEKELKAVSNEVNNLKQQLAQKQIVPEEFSTLDSRCHELDQRINRLGVEKRKLVQQNWNLQFDYRDPVPNFNRNAVHGFLFELFTVKEPQKYGKPLEVASAESWFNVIVDTPNISKDLIEKGNLPRRTTFMHLSAIHPSTTAKQSELDRVLGRGKAVVAMDLLDFDPKYTNLMANYFGRLVICNDIPVAKTVAFNMKFKAITMDGDVLIDPDGIVMQGGTSKNLGKTLEICKQFSGVNSELGGKTHELSELKRKLDYYRRFEGLIKSYEIAERKLKSLEDLRKCTAFASLTREIAELQGEIAKRKEILKEWDTQLKKLRKESTSLKNKLECEDEVKTKDLKDIRGQIKKYKKDFDTATKKYAAKQKMYSDIDLDVNAKHDLLANYQKDIDSAKKDLEEVVAKKNTLDQELANFKEKEAVVKDILKENELLDAEVGALDKQIQEFLKKKQKLEVTKIKRDNEINVYIQKLKTCTNELDDLKQNHNNVNFDDYENLPKPKESADELRNILAKAIKRKEEMSTKVDMESAEKLEVITLEGAKMVDERSKVVEKNRGDDITSAIDTLDEQKLKIVTDAYDQINREFGLMMTTLLPEAQAKLVQVNDKDLSEGLNIHVCLGGGAWKESLLELSGGERSLVGLALTISLCMFNPAPFYILDKIDAALDLSHTQNMGLIIQQRFKDTQFVCVSLKEGMFSKANVLYNVALHHGVSTIERRARILIASKNEETANRNRDGDGD